MDSPRHVNIDFWNASRLIKKEIDSNNNLWENFKKYIAANEDMSLFVF